MNLPLWFAEARRLASSGQLPQYIPILSDTKRKNEICVAIADSRSRIYSFGDKNLTFPLMSVVKPFLLFYLLSESNLEIIPSKVGQTPSPYAFNSLEQLREDKGFPRNPMINSGALLLTDLLPGDTPSQRCENLRQWLNQMAETNLFLDLNVLRSVESLPNLKNRDLVRELTLHNRLNDPETVLETYNHICCLSGTITDLLHLGLLLIQSGSQASNLVLEIMKGCGLYEASASLAESLGYATKSGVSGAILSIIPERGAGGQPAFGFACYSPPLDAQGNSVAGLYLLRQLAGISFPELVSQFPLESHEISQSQP